MEDNTQPIPEKPARKSAILEAKPQALINRMLVTRFVIAVILLGTVLGAYIYFQSLGDDIDLPANADTRGQIAAVKYGENGAQAVVIKPDGQVVESPEYRSGATDRDLVWRPDGNRLFFSSDRKDNAYQIFRWNPASNSVMQRTVTKGGSKPAFPNFTVDGANDTALILRGGYVLEFDPKELRTTQVLPPAKQATSSSTDTAGGLSNQFEAIYQSLGSSFKAAAWAFNKEFIAAIMRRDNGDVLVMQPMNVSDPMAARPIPIAAGDRIDMAIDPKTGGVIYAVIGFQFPNQDEIPPEYIKEKIVEENGQKRKVQIFTPPFQNGLGYLTLNGKDLQNVLVAQNQQQDAALCQPAVSPDGTMVAAVIAKNMGNGSLEHKKLVIMPLQQNGASAGANLVKGEVYEPSWSKDGNTILFAMRQDGFRALYSVRKDGGELKNLTGNKGNFGFPTMSPQG